MDAQAFAALPLPKRRKLLSTWRAHDARCNSNPIFSQSYQVTNFVGVWRITAAGDVSLREHKLHYPRPVSACELIKMQKKDVKNKDYHQRVSSCVDVSDPDNWLHFGAEHAERARDSALKFGGGSKHNTVPAEIVAACARATVKTLSERCKQDSPWWRPTSKKNGGRD